MLQLKAFDCRMCTSKANCPDYEDPVTSPGLLSKACSEFKPHVPGPSESDPNIMELCFHNGERHMKERILTKLKDFSADIMFEQRITGEVKVATFEQVIQILEDL